MAGYNFNKETNVGGGARKQLKNFTKFKVNGSCECILARPDLWKRFWG